MHHACYNLSNEHVSFGHVYFLKYFDFDFLKKRLPIKKRNSNYGFLENKQAYKPNQNKLFHEKKII